MVKTFFTAILMLVLSQSIFSQGWQWVDTGYPFIIYDVSFPSGQSDVGYAVGSSVTYNGDGIILKTTDGGQSWSQISVGTIPGLEGVFFTSVDVGYAGGWQNYFIKTTDGGATWNQINVNAGIWYFKEIEFWDANNGMTSTSDPAIYVTTDAGATWTAATGLTQGVEDICYVDANTVYAVGGDEKMSRSTDGGLSWSQIYSGIPTFYFLGVSFYDANYGIVSGEEGKVLVTTNGGTTWTTSNAGGFGLMRSVWIFNQDSSYVVGTPEQIFKSTDSGLNWVEDFTSGYQVALYKIKFTENGTGIICGSQGKFLRNTDYVQQDQAQSYAFNGGVFSYGTIDLTTGLFTSLNFYPQGSSYYPAAGDNKEVDAQYAIMSDFSFPANYYLWHIDFGTMSGDSIAPVGPLATGQSSIKCMSYDVMTDMWYVISGDDFASSAYLYTLDITNGTLTTVGQIQNADAPVGMAIDCEGNAYIVNVAGAITTTAVLNSLNLTTATATPIGTDLGLANVSYFNQDMDFDQDNGNLYWCGYWTSGFFSEGGSFRQVDVTNGTSTELAAYGQFNNLNGFNVNAICPPPPPPTAESYAFNGGVFSYGTIDLTTGLWTTMNFTPQGSSYSPVAGDNDAVESQYVIMSDFSFPSNYYLWHVDFGTMTGDSIAPVGPLASGQNIIKGMAYDVTTDTWYVVSSNDFGSAGHLYTMNISTGVLTSIGQIQNADLPVGMAIDCEGNAYIVNIVIGISGTAVLNSLNLSTAVATAIGTNLGLADASAFSQDMDFDPDNGNLYWCGYWTSGFFSEGGSFRLVDVTTGTSTELAAYGQFNNLPGFNVNAICPPVPVELTSFAATVNETSVTLSWATATETNNSGFQVERKSNQSEWVNIGFVPGFGTTTETHSYSYKDTKLAAGNYSYRLKQVDYDGSYEYSNEVEVLVVIPGKYALDQNYPNPFNPSTTIEFSIPNSELVNIVVYNALGEKVTELVNTILPEGQHKIVFDAARLASGIYIVRMKAGSFNQTIKMNLLK